MDLCVDNRHSSHSQMVDLLSYWFSVLGRFGTVEVVPTFVLNAAEFLNNTIVNNLKELLLDHGLQGISHHSMRVHETACPLQMMGWEDSST